MDPLRKLIREIHRRSLWQVLGIYAVGAWVVLQVIDTLEGVMTLPDWFAGLAIGLLILGLPVVLATAFVQEGGPGHHAADSDVNPGGPDGGEEPAAGASEASVGGERAVAGSTEATAARILTWKHALGGGVVAFAVVGVIAVGSAILGGGPDRGAVGRATAGPGGASAGTVVAVLPFENNSPDSANVYFTDGVHEDILTELSKVSDLTVISRTSVMQYRDAPPENLRQIGRDLGATAILEGSVRREGNRIRVTAQLIDATTDTHLWAETYDRDLEDVFAVQSEVALKVAEALEATLAPEESARIAEIPTDNIDAYDLVIQARELSRRFTSDDNAEAIRLLEQAVQLDPGYAEAWAGLASALSNIPYRYGGDPALADSALVLAERARSLDPEEPRVHSSLGFVYGTKGWERRAMEEFERAVELDPNFSTGWNNLGASLSQYGRLDEAVSALRRSIRLDPTAMLPRTNLASVYLTVGDTASARRLFLEAQAVVPPGTPVARVAGLQTELAMASAAGDRARVTDLARQLLEIQEDLVASAPTSPDLHFGAVTAAVGAQDWGRVIQHAREGLRLSPNAPDQGRVVADVALGIALQEDGQATEGEDVLRGAIERRLRMIANGNDQPNTRVALAVSYTALGDIDSAVEAVQEVYDMGGLTIFRNLESQLPPRFNAFLLEPRVQAIFDQAREDLAEMRTRIDALGEE